MIRLLIADDHAIMREGLRQLIAFDRNLEVAAVAENGNQVLERLREAMVDLLLLDMSMPGLSGEDLITRLRARYPGLPILVLSMHNEAQIAQRALRAGAAGYLTKDHDPETLLAAIHRVAGGGRYIDPRIAESIAFGANQTSKEGADCLSDREFQILRLLGQGLTVNQIAEQLVISNKTVSTHKTRLMEKMAFASNADIVKYAVNHGLV